MGAALHSKKGISTASESDFFFLRRVLYNGVDVVGHVLEDSPSAFSRPLFSRPADGARDKSEVLYLTSTTSSLASVVAGFDIACVFDT